MNYKIYLFLFLSFSLHSLQAQQGGTREFNFLNIAPSSYSHALGGIMISNASNDITTALQNPATLSSQTKNAISFNHTFNFSGINSGYFAYGNTMKKSGLDWHAAIQYTNYGTFTGADEWGNKTGEFKAADYAFVFGVTKHLNEKFHIGVNNKFIYSRLESYIATGLAFDIGAYYEMKDKNASLGVVARNIGFVSKAYVDNSALLPFDIQVGFTKKLKHLPFQYNITAHHLYKWDVRYDDPNLQETDLFGEAEGTSNFGKFSDNLFSHLIFGGEFLLGKKQNLKIRFAYNHMIRQELAVKDIRSITGFSGGVEFKIKRFFIAYSIGMQHTHGSIKQLSLSTNLSTFKKKK